MKKYIRTKDGIVNATTFVKWVNGTWYDQESNNYVDEEEIVQIADAIDELLDAIVEKRDIDGEPPSIVPKCQLEEYKKLEQFGGHVKSKVKREVKGAIWTDKGLIYVAKLNEKGELELL